LKEFLLIQALLLGVNLPLVLVLLLVMVLPQAHQHLVPHILMVVLLGSVLILHQEITWLFRQQDCLMF
jgi:hypothetical protein